MRKSKSHVSIYFRPEGTYISPSDRTTAGLWIGNAEVTKIGELDPNEIGGAVIRGLKTSKLDVPHPGRDEWSAQRRRSLGPIVKLAGLRSWRAFIKAANLVEVWSDGASIVVTAMQRDLRRLDVFYPSKDIPEQAIPMSDASPERIGLAAISVAESSA